MICQCCVCSAVPKRAENSGLGTATSLLKETSVDGGGAQTPVEGHMLLHCKNIKPPPASLSINIKVGCYNLLEQTTSAAISVEMTASHRSLQTGELLHTMCQSNRSFEKLCI